MEMQETQKLLSVYNESIPIIISECLTKKMEYSIVEINAFNQLINQSPLIGHRIYWYEIIQRAHLISMIGLHRSSALSRSLAYDYETNNLISYANNLRCFIESAGDIMDALSTAIATFADNYYTINSIVNNLGRVQGFAFNEELENKLLHFTEAKKLTTDEKLKLPSYYNAKHTSEYVSTLNGSDEGKSISNLYSILCALSHPSAESVAYFLNLGKDETIYSYVYSFKNDYSGQMIDFNNKYEKEILNALYYGFNFSLICLKTVSKFNISELYLESIEKMNIDIKAWKDIEEKINVQSNLNT